jgi:hypothetical protein
VGCAFTGDDIASEHFKESAGSFFFSSDMKYYNEFRAYVCLAAAGASTDCGQTTTEPPPPL